MKILICSDGSEQAERAVRLGSTLAAGCHAEVTLLGIAENPDSEALLASLKRGTSLLADKKVQAELVVKTGAPIAEIIRHTQQARYDLVIIGAVRKETRGLFWMSSKAYKIIKGIEPPVLLVMGRTTAIQRVLICSGGKQFIDPAVRLAGELARCLGASVTLLHVMPELPAIYARLPGLEQAPELVLGSPSELGRSLRSEKETLQSLGVAAAVRLRQGPVLHEILREMREGAYDLVVTGSAPSRSLRTYVLGNISREIVNRADCAVLLFRTY